MKKEESSPKSSASSMHTAHLHHEIELDQNSGENITQSAYGSPAPEVEGKSIRTDDFRGKLPGLVDLTVPSSPGFPTDLLNDSWIGNTSEDDSSGSGSPEANTLLKGKPFPTFTRLKTRLQDAPSLTPAVKSQLTYCSSLTSRRGSFKSNSEEQNSAVDCGPTNNSLSQLTDQTASTQRNSSLGHISSNLKLNTNLLANGEEDKDPFDDDFIPDHKKGKESKWLMAIQWFSLFILVALLVCTVKIYILEKVTFVGLNLWRWQALALVIFCGQLMSGWIMKAGYSC